jgi:hypothetical protein
MLGGEVTLDAASRRTLSDLASPPMPGEEALFRSLLALQPQLIDRAVVDTAVVGNCHANAARFAATVDEVEVLYGWADLGEYFVLHSVVRFADMEEDRAICCVSPGYGEWLVFRPDPDLRLVRPWVFERHGIEMPTIVRRSPVATAEEAQEVMQELEAGTCTGWSQRIAGDQRGAEPDRVMASLNT